MSQDPRRLIEDAREWMPRNEAVPLLIKALEETLEDVQALEEALSLEQELRRREIGEIEVALRFYARKDSDVYVEYYDSLMEETRVDTGEVAREALRRQEQEEER